MKTFYATTIRDDPFMDFIFTTRLYWFLQEIYGHAEHLGKEEEITEKCDMDDANFFRKRK